MTSMELDGVDFYMNPQPVCYDGIFEPFLSLLKTSTRSVTRPAIQPIGTRSSPLAIPRSPTPQLIQPATTFNRESLLAKFAQPIVQPATFAPTVKLPLVQPPLIQPATFAPTVIQPRVILPVMHHSAFDDQEDEIVDIININNASDDEDEEEDDDDNHSVASLLERAAAAEDEDNE